jgi:hypothetical protein
MSKKSRKTLAQKQKADVFRDSSGDYGLTDPGEIEKSYQDSARQLWQLGQTWEERLAYYVFGSEKMGSWAFALDPFARFKAGFKLVAPTSRDRRGKDNIFKQQAYWSADFKRYQNYDPDGESVPEYLAFHEIDQDDYTNTQLDLTRKMSDSVQSQRKSFQHFGLMQRQEAKIDARIFPDFKYSEIIYDHREDDGQYDRSVNTYDLDFGVHKVPGLVPPWGWAGYETYDADIVAFTDGFASAHAQDIIPKCLANRRQYNSLYQLVELKDLPQLIKGSRDFLAFLKDLKNDLSKAVLHADKVAAGSYLTWIFGYQSIQQAVQSLVTYPTRLAKKVNYLLQKNSKLEPVRSKKIYDDPSLQFYRVKDRIAEMVPVPYFDTKGLKILDLSRVELSCAITQRINFPKVGTPYATAKTLANSIGLTPRIKDVYDLIPWTWLVDWFIGLSSYIDMVEAVNGDFQIINVGFITVKVVSEFAISGTLTVYDAEIHNYVDGRDQTIEYSNARGVDVSLLCSSTFVKRYNVADLGSVKAMGPPDDLSDPQKSIVGALFEKFL